jgi:site-specific recombinase XerD
MEELWRDLELVSSSPLKNPADSRFLHVRNAAALEILFATGMRVGELVSLTLQDWREDERTFVVRGKGSRQRLAFLPDDRSLKAVHLYLKHRRALDIGHDALFVNFAGNQLSTQGVARIVAETATAAKVTQRVTPHMIRHTVATLLLRFGADIRIVQEVLGHASIATTQRYTHVSKEHLFSVLRDRHPNHHLKIDWPAPAPHQT